MAQGYQVTQDVTLPAYTVISNEITVKEGATLTIPANGELHFEAEGKLIIDESATLVISDYAIIISFNNSEIFVEGVIEIGSNVSFISDEGAEIQLEVNNTSLVTTINHGEFSRCSLISNQNALTLSNCNFNVSGGVDFSRGNLTVNSCNFDHTNLHVANASSATRQVNINNQCTFEDYPGYALHIENYAIYNISNNTFTGNTSAIGIFNSGNRSSLITNNTITGGGNGIVVYNSSANVTSNSLAYNGNIIRNNYVGIRSLDRSIVNLTGYSGAKLIYETQQINDNIYEEIIASQGSFPCPFRYNAIIDDDNNVGNPPFYYLVKSLTTIEENFNVQYNYWGTSFNYLDDLYPPELYTWEPVFSLIGYGSGGGEDESLLNSAEAKIMAEDYSGAKSDLQTLVEEYPATVFAQTALKKLFSLEELAGNNYNSLKEYYLTHSAIQGDSSLAKLADFLSNFCDIKLENWPTAIDWFENVIQNPETFEDSIFAIIDLGYTYWLMENGEYKSTYVGNLTQYKFSNHNDFENNRDYLLSLLPGDNISERMNQNVNALKAGELMQNIPNPFTGTTKIYYKLEDEVTVQLDVYNYTGQLVESINEGTKTKGTHHINFDATGLKNGLYFYSIIVNGQTSDSKKMTIMK